MSNTWKQWEGQILDGKFVLHRYLGESEQGAVFLTERRDGENFARAAIKLVPAGPEKSELQLSRWRMAAELSHPHLIPIYEMGRADLGGAPLVYAAMECAEENLAQVLPSRALTPAEARDMLASVLDVLSYLHHKGFVHGHIKPANIMASGEQLKVSSDGICRAGESADCLGTRDAYDAPENFSNHPPMSRSLSPAGDVWSLGIALVETLTQNLPAARTAEQLEPVLPRSLPEPFLDIARHCLNLQPASRWTVDQIAARLEGRATVHHSPSIPAAVRTPAPPVQRAAGDSGQPGKRRSYAAPAAVAAALALVAIVAVPKLLRRSPDAPQTPAATVEPPATPPAPKPAAPSPQERASKPVMPAASEEGRNSKAPVPVPALIHPGTIHEEETNTVARIPAGPVSHGEVAHQVTPDVLPSAKNSIRGTVRVIVKVNVDRSGNVEDAQLESRGPSKYFARAALDAAQDWKFKAPRVGGRGVLSTWTLRFEFTRDGTTIIPTQEMP